MALKKEEKRLNKKVLIGIAVFVVLLLIVAGVFFSVACSIAHSFMFVNYILTINDKYYMFAQSGMTDLQTPYAYSR